MARTSVQSYAFTNKLAKLSYQVRGPFRIVTCTRRGSDLVRKLYKPDSSDLKFMAADLYPISPSLKPCESFYNPDTRYLNQSYPPIVNPLSKPLNIELCNEAWFDKQPRISKLLFEYDNPTLDFPDCPSTLFHPLSDLHVATRTPCVSPLIEKSDSNFIHFKN